MKSPCSVAQKRKSKSNLKPQSRTHLEPKLEPSQEKHFTVTEIAKKLSTTTKTVRAWCVSGRMIAVPILFGTKTSYKVSTSALDEFLTQNRDSKNLAWVRGSAYQFLIAEWKLSMAKGVFNGKPFSPITVSYYASYVERLIRKHGTFSYPVIKSEFLSIPVEQFGKKDKFYKSVVCFAKFLIEEKELGEAFLDDLKKLKPKRHLPPKKTVVNELELGKLIEASETELDRALLIVLSQTGLRASECAALKVCDIDFEQQALTVQIGKGGKRRVIGLSFETIKAVQHYLGNRILQLEQPLFLNELHLQIDRHGIRMRMDKLTRKTGIKVTAHSLRRAFVTINANKGRPLQMLQIACGHSDINITRDYCMTTEQEVIDAMKNW